MILKRGTKKCPDDGVDLEWRQAFGHNLIEMVFPEKPKKPFWVYGARCPKCNKNYAVKK